MKRPDLSLLDKEQASREYQQQLDLYLYQYLNPNNFYQDLYPLKKRIKYFLKADLSSTFHEQSLQTAIQTLKTYSNNNFLFKFEPNLSKLRQKDPTSGRAMGYY
jgi:hypothetical protein